MHLDHVNANDEGQQVALVGSSGGGTATLGHTDPQELLTIIHTELGKCIPPKKLKYALYVSLLGGAGMDGVDDLSRQEARLYGVGFDKEDDDYNINNNNNNNGRGINVQVLAHGTLQQVNQAYVKYDLMLSSLIVNKNNISGFISISSDPIGVNKQSFQALSKMGIPVTGSGGTSLSIATSNYDINLVGNAGGSVATTNYTKAVSFCFALSATWQIPYKPFAAMSSNCSTYNKKQNASIKSVLETCLPAFLTVCLLLSFLEKYTIESWSYKSDFIMQQLQTRVLPVVCCVVAASTYANEHGTTSIMSAAVAATCCATNSVIGGLLVGWFTSYCVTYFLIFCIQMNIPATMTNILVAGGVGGLVSVVMSLLNVMDHCHLVTSLLRRTLLCISYYPGAGFLFGCIFCYGSKIGWYHGVFLPVILLEMENGKASLCGAVDECTLVLVSAGVCAANVLTSPNKGTVSLSKRGLRINLSFGDFIEAAYPSMDSSSVINLSAYLASGISAEILFRNHVFSSAYLPFPVCIWLANEQWQSMGLSCSLAFSISFLGTLLSNSFDNIKRRKCQ